MSQNFNILDEYSNLLTENYNGFILTKNIFTLINMKIKYIFTKFYNYLIHQIFNNITHIKNMKEKIEQSNLNDSLCEYIKNINKNKPYIFKIDDIELNKDLLTKLLEKSHVNINKDMKYFYDKNINNHDSKEYIEEFINHINNYDSNSEEKIYDNDDFNDIIINIINSKKKL
tara:strand:- start:275 stop:790 length:516 start_codon:yes stop_codon:yes gene_type:complete